MGNFKIILKRMWESVTVTDVYYASIFAVISICFGLYGQLTHNEYMKAANVLMHTVPLLIFLLLEFKYRNKYLSYIKDGHEQLTKIFFHMNGHMGIMLIITILMGFSGTGGIFVIYITFRYLKDLYNIKSLVKKLKI